uniref:Uncharacterized protein n=1 Tax=Cacopsylla melanoneura TaxID=428564 RepID=A0A8D9B8Y1_9HEMI
MEDQQQRLSIFTIGVGILISSTLVSTHPLAAPTNDYGAYHADSYPQDHPSDPSSYQTKSELPTGGSASSYSASVYSLAQQPVASAYSAYSLTSYLNPISYFSSHGSETTGGSSSYAPGGSGGSPSYGSGSPGYGSDPHQPPNPNDPGYKPSGPSYGSGGLSSYGSGPSGGSHEPSYTPKGSPPGYGSDPAHQPPPNPYDPAGYKPSGMDSAYGPLGKPSGTDSKYAPGTAGALNLDLKYGGLPGLNSKYGPPPLPPGMDSKYGPPPPPPGNGPPPHGGPPGMDSKYGPPPPPPGNSDPTKYGQKSTDYGTPTGGGGSDPTEHSPGNNRAYDIASGTKYPDYSAGGGNGGAGGYSTGGGAKYGEY